MGIRTRTIKVQYSYTNAITKAYFEAEVSLATMLSVQNKSK